MEKYKRKFSRLVFNVSSPPMFAHFVKPLTRSVQTYGKSKNYLMNLLINPNPPLKTNSPAISVIVPMYNREKYIGECLDSLLAQTFQNFEVIVIDDCSTDNSVTVVEGYKEKFGGQRLKLIKMEKNTGHPGEPRNKGISMASGEYIYCLDSDDIITETAFEEMYTLAKEYNADVVYCEKYYISEGTGQKFRENIRITETKLQKPPFVKEPTLETEDLGERVENLLNWKYWMTAWLKLVKRNLLIENKIIFPPTFISEDVIWNAKLLFCSKRFLRVPNIWYVRRMHEASIMGITRTTSDHVQRWMDVIIHCLKDLDNFMKRIDFFRENPDYRYKIIQHLVRGSFANIREKCSKESDFDIYSIFQEKFGEYLGENDVLVSNLCTYIVNLHKELSKKPKKSFKESEQHISEKEEEIKRLNAKINSMSSLLTLRLTVPAVSVIIPLYNAEEYIADCLDSLLNQTFHDFEVIVVDDCSTDASLAIVEDYAPKFNGRFTITKTEINSGTGGYVPRNIGFNLARGKYVFFLDADDYLLNNSLEILYNMAEEYNADVVYTSARYTLWKPNTPSLTRDGRGQDLLAKGLEDKLTLIVENPDENLHMLIQEKGFTVPWVHFVKRSFLIENQITFPEIPKAGDYIWAIHIYCYAKRFLRLPTPLYCYRRYNLNSVSKRSSSDQFSNWVVSFIVFAKTLRELSNKSEVLKNNFTYFYEASSLYFEWCINRTDKARENLSNQDIYEILYNEFKNEDDLSDFSIPFLFSVIDAAKKSNDSNLQTINRLKKGFSKNNILPETPLNCPAVSIIIPLYNSEKYIGELLDSILAQTFQNFEVIVVDDCSTDNSAVIVEIYASRFGGRLRLTKTEKNSGSPGEPGNIGVALSRGEYLFILDNDDTITPDALEKLYTVAKDFNADVVTCENFYWVPEESWDNAEFRKNLKPSSYKKGDFVTKPTLIPFDIANRVQDIKERKFLWSLWQKLIRRDFLIENKIRFTNNIIQDFLATCCLAYTAKIFVRVPYAINFYRARKTSLYRQKRDPLRQLKMYLRALNAGFKYLSDFLRDKEFFQENPEIKLLALNIYFREVWDIYIKKCYDEVSIREREEALRAEFTDTENTALTIFLFDFLSEITKIQEREIIKIQEREVKSISKFLPYLTSRVDVKLLSQGKGDFQIVSVSDDKAEVKKPSWLQKGGIGYQIQSYEGKIQIVTKATSDGQIKLELKSLDVPDPENKSKRIPYWIDYTNLTINGKRIFNRRTPTWHDKPYKYTLDVKAGEEIKIQTEWLPHKGEAPAPPPPPPPVVIKEVEPILDKFLPYLTSRVDIQLLSQGKGDFQIVSVSDDKAEVKKPEWLQKDGIGYQIQSHNGNMEIVAKATANGKIQLNLKGMNIPDPKDKSKRLPYWIDYTKLTVNGQTIFDELTPAWHDKAYNYSFNVKAGEEIKFQVEWLPHNGEAPAPPPPPPPPVVIKEVEPILDKFLPYLTSRVDIQLLSQGKGDFQIVSVSDDKAEVKKPKWLQKDGIGYQIQSHNGKMEIIAKATADGQIKLKLRSLDIRDSKEKSKPVPYWVDYTNLTINGQNIFDKLTPAWWGKPYDYTLNVKAGEEIKIQTEWLPHRSE